MDKEIKKVEEWEMRGFVTLAVGDEKYYKLAVNLLKSYKHNTKERFPFAIIADRENQYTRLFDKTILLKDASCSYMDKLEMLNNPPFDENIFIDTDCLVYKDINKYWDYFSEYVAEGVTCFGKALPITSHEGWFELENIGEYKNKIKFIPQMHGGILFFKNDDLTKVIYKTVLSIAENYRRYRFKYFDNPADEPILALSMAVNNIKPIDLPQGEKEQVFLFYPTVRKAFIDMKMGKVSYKNGKGDLVEDVLLVHWQNINTEKPKYKIEVKKIDDNFKFVLFLLNIWYYLSYYVKYNFGRVGNKLMQKMKQRSKL